MDGAVLSPALSPAFRRLRPVETVATFETTGRARVAAGTGDRKEDERTLRDLRTLGYIGGPAESGQPDSPAPDTP